MTDVSEKLFEFKFFDGQVFKGHGASERDALVRLGLGEYNPVAYTAREIVAESVPVEKRIDRADELLARLIDDIGTGPALDRLRKDALRIKHVLRGLDW